MHPAWRELGGSILCHCRKLCVPCCALLCWWCLTRSTKHGGTLPAFLPLLCSSVFGGCPNTQLHLSSLLSCRYWASVRHEFPFFFFCGNILRYIHPSMSVAFIYIWWRGTVLEVASFSTVLFTQVFQGYNYEQTFVNDMHACQADGSPDASVLLSSLLAVFPVCIPLLQTVWRLSYVVAVFSSKEKKCWMTSTSPLQHKHYDSEVQNVSLKFKVSSFV